MPSAFVKTPFYYGWVNVVIAAIVMLATLPGRTHGLGLVTEPLLKDLQLDRVTFANINLWATLAGALFCIPAGALIDRFGVRMVTTLVTIGLGLVVWQISVFTSGAVWFFILITLTRGLGQSALSVTSITAVGKWFTRRLGAAMGIYSFLIGLLFMTAFGVVGYAVREQGWRMAWKEIAMVLLFGVAPLVWLLLRDSPESCGLAPDSGPVESPTDSTHSFTLSEAMRTPAFWVFAGGASMFGLVSSGLGLFNQSVLGEHGFDQKVYITFMMTTTFIGLIGQLASGWVLMRWSICRLMAVALFLYAASLAGLPLVKSLAGLWTFSVGAGLAGGIITVVFFAIWGRAFGRRHLGRIQAAGQILTVLASALGPLVFAKCYAATHSYSPILLSLAVVVLLFGVASWTIGLPTAEAPAFNPLSTAVTAPEQV